MNVGIDYRVFNGGSVLNMWILRGEYQFFSFNKINAVYVDTIYLMFECGIY